MIWHVDSTYNLFTNLNVDFDGCLPLVLNIFFHRENYILLSGVGGNRQNILERYDVGFVKEYLQIVVVDIEMLNPSNKTFRSSKNKGMILDDDVASPRGLCALIPLVGNS